MKKQKAFENETFILIFKNMYIFYPLLKIFEDK